MKKTLEENVLISAGRKTEKKGLVYIITIRMIVDIISR